MAKEDARKWWHMGMQMGKQDRIRSSFSIAKSDCQRTTEGNIQIQDPSFLMVEEDQKLVCQCDSQLVGGSILPTPHYVDSSCPQLDFPTIPTVSCFPDSQVVSGSCAFFWCVCVWNVNGLLGKPAWVVAENPTAGHIPSKICFSCSNSHCFDGLIPMFIIFVTWLAFWPLFVVG